MQRHASPMSAGQPRCWAVGNTGTVRTESSSLGPRSGRSPEWALEEVESRREEGRGPEITPPSPSRAGLPLQAASFTEHLLVVTGRPRQLTGVVSRHDRRLTADGCCHGWRVWMSSAVPAPSSNQSGVQDSVRHPLTPLLRDTATAVGRRPLSGADP